jgi:protein MPE1
VCPNCGKRVASLDKLEMDKPMRTKVTDYIEQIVEDSKKEGGEEASTPPGAVASGSQVYSVSY